jgi:immunity protein, SdpI family
MSAAVRKSPVVDLFTLFAVLGAFVVTVLLYDRLPDPLPIHFDLSGRPNGWAPRAVGAWLLPGIEVLVVVLLRFGRHLLGRGWRERLDASPVRMLALVTAFMMTSVHVVVLHASLSALPNLGNAIWVLLGALFVALGILLPRSRRNPFFGVRTAFALASDENWARTQRVAGWTMVGGGIITIAAGLLGLPVVAIATILTSALVPAIWSWVLAKRGTGDVPPIPR